MIVLFYVLILFFDFRFAFGWQNDDFESVDSFGEDFENGKWNNKNIPPGVSILMLAQKELSSVSVWEEWYRIGIKWAEKEFGLKNNSKEIKLLLNGFVHVDRKYDPEGKIEVPSWMVKMQNPSLCQRNFRNRCWLRLFVTAFPQESTEWFVTVSDDSIPVISFKQLYESLIQNGRSRIEVQRFNFKSGLPRVFPWMIFRRWHMRILIASHSQWVSLMGRRPDGVPNDISQPEEHSWTEIIFKKIKNKYPWTTFNDGNKYLKQNEVEKEECSIFMTDVPLTTRDQMMLKMSSTNNFENDKNKIKNNKIENKINNNNNKIENNNFLKSGWGPMFSCNIFNKNSFCEILGGVKMIEEEEKEENQISEYEFINWNNFKEFILNNPDIYFARKFKKNTTTNYDSDEEIDLLNSKVIEFMRNSN